MESQEYRTIGLEQYLLILKRRWLTASSVFVLIFAVVVLAAFVKKPVYLAEGKLLLKRESPTSSLTGLGKEIGQLEPLYEQSSPLDTETVVILSEPLVQKTIATLNLKNEKGESLERDRFLEKLSVSKVESADILQITYRDTDPKKAAAVVNTLIDFYLEDNALVNRAETIAAREFVEKQLPKAEATVRQAESALRRFKEDNQIIALAEEAKAAVERTESLQRQIATARSRIANINTQSEVLRNQIGMNSRQAEAVTSLSQSPAVQEILQELQQTEARLAIERTRFTETNPVIVDLKSKVTALRALLPGRVETVLKTRKQQPNGNFQNGELQQELTAKLLELEAGRLGLVSQVADLSDALTAYRQRAAILPRLEQQQRELERKLQASQSTYSLLLQKLQEIRVAENQNVGNARIVAPASVPLKPVAPRKVIYVAAGVLLGSLLSLATALILEAKDDSIKTVDEAKQLFEFTVLGVIPFLGESKGRDRSLEPLIPKIILRDNPSLPISESYRMLRTNLKSLDVDKQQKIVVVTSSVPKEGKSTVSANLAVALAQLGQKVLLIDADLHRPLQHRIWELDNGVGLSNVLVGQVEPEKAITEAMANLYVLTSGVVPPSPAALLDSQKMALLFEYCASEYDFTIVDTPSLCSAADAPILGRIADGVLLVVRPGVADAAGTDWAREILMQSNQKVLGIAINGVIRDREPYSYSYFAPEYYAEDSSIANHAKANHRRLHRVTPTSRK